METIEKLAYKYLQGRASHKEVARVLAWFKTEAGEEFLKASLDNDIKDIESGKILFTASVDEQKILSVVFEGRDAKEKSVGNARYWYAIAASVLLLVGSISAFLLTHDSTITYTSAFGETKEVILPDESKVILNGNSTLRIPKTWSAESDREVWLTGEAFFSVTHSQNHNKFRVHTSDKFTVEVLGTEFNVNSRADITKVMLERGSISLTIEEGSKPKYVKMKPGEYVEYNEKSYYLIKQEVKTETANSWKDGQLIFEDDTIEDIAHIIKETYGLKLIVNDTLLLRQRITGTVPNKNIELFLHGLEEILDVTIHTKDGFIYIEKDTPQL